MTTFDVGTGTLRPLSGHTKQQGHGFMHKTLTTVDFRQQSQAFTYIKLTKASEWEGIALLHYTGRRLGHVLVAAVPNHLTLHQGASRSRPGPSSAMHSGVS